MPSPYATTVAVGYSGNLMNWVYARSLVDQIVNRDYEGEILAVGSKLIIGALEKVSEKTYANAAMTADTHQEYTSTLTIDQFKSFYIKEKTIEKFQSFIKNPNNSTTSQRGDERKKNLETYLLGFYGKVQAGNRVGTDYTTGTVAVANTTGVVTGSGTTFTAAMVGRGFKATGHTKWYRVKTYTSATSITIEDDLDDVTSAYTGGAISSSATYTIEAATPVQLTAANFLTQLGNLKQKLDDWEVPDSDRLVIVPPIVENVCMRATGVVLSVPAYYQDLVTKGFLTELVGFKIFRSTRVAGDNVNGWRILAMHRNWLTFADKLLEAGMEEDLPGDFGAAYKDLYVYGAKVADIRRRFAAEMFAYV